MAERSSLLGATRVEKAASCALAYRAMTGWAAEGSTLRQDQLADLRVALPWVAEQLGLPSP